MIIEFLGDSITEGALASSEDKCLVSLVGQMLHAEVHNHGISGSRIARQRTPSAQPRFDLYFRPRVSGLDPNADFVFVFGGTNDYGHGDAPIGEPGDRTDDTFYGAFTLLVEELLKKYPKEKICFISILHRRNEDDPKGDGSVEKPTPRPLKDYVAIEEEIIRKNGLNYLDIRDKFGLVEGNPLFGDGLHPTDLGHQKLAEFVVSYIRSKTDQ